jgi:hypothetical protein
MQQGGILFKKKYAIVSFLFCLYASVEAWRRMFWAAHAQQRAVNYFGHYFQADPVHIFGFAWSVLITASFAVKSPFKPDRFVFGLASLCLALGMIAEIYPLTSFTLLAVRQARAIAWTVAAVISLKQAIEARPDFPNSE